MTGRFRREARGYVLLPLGVVVLVLIGVLASSVGGAGAASLVRAGSVTVGRDVKHDQSPALRTVSPVAGKAAPTQRSLPVLPATQNQANAADTVVQNKPFVPNMPAPNLNFDGIAFPGVVCNCAPPDTDGQVGKTQYVQIVNEGVQVFNKATGASELGPISIASLWTGFGGVCENNGNGDPIAVYDQLADRWLISQFAGTAVPATDECIAISTSGDATGTYYRYDFHLGSNFFDYPKIAVWPDAYYMSMNVFNPAGSARLGPQPFAFDRAAMLTGSSATFVTTGITNGVNEPLYMPTNLDGSTLPPTGAPDSFIEWPGSGAYKIWHFHADFVTPANTTFTLFASPAAAPFTQLATDVPQAGTTDKLDTLGDRLMFRAADRFFSDHESTVINYSVSSGGVAGVRWVELRNVTAGPVAVYQESTYQPDSTWRWMGSVAMDGVGDIAVGYSASSGSINPQIRYAGRLVTDPLNTLAQGEATLFAGTGSQTDTGSRWGDYSDLTVDPVDNCTFWYTNEYYSTTSSFNWKTRIGSFHFPFCLKPATITVTKHVISNSLDPGRFNLRIDGTTYAANVGNGGTTGPIAVTSSDHTVSETAAGATNLSNYVASISCSNGQHGPGTSLNVHANPGDNITCTITNQRKLFKVG